APAPPRSHTLPTRRSSDLAASAATEASRPPVPAGRRPPRYRSVMAATRLTRLPRLLARSALYFSSKRSHVKSPSPPYGTSFTRRSEEHTSELQSREKLVCR